MQRGIMFLALALGLLATAAAQGAGEQYSQEAGPEINLRKCTAPGSCKTEKKKLTMDANWRWVHIQGDYKNCYKGNLWVEEFCPGDDGAACAQKCQIEGITLEQYGTTYGVKEVGGGDGVSMKLVNKHEYGISVGARLYMYDNDKYEMFHMPNQEFAFDADMSQLECGINGAVYFIEMQENGGMGIGNNKAGAKYGTGYCDAQCPHDIKFIDGEANLKDWKPNPKDKSNNMGTGHYGACCNEMDIWEANARSNAYTPHPCSKESMYRCEGTECGDNEKGERYKGVCDKDGCDFASWRMGGRKFYGKGDEFTINTAKKLTQVTQFLTKDGSDDGELVEIRRIWKQDDKVIENTDSTVLRGAMNRRRSKEKIKGDCRGAGNSLQDDICKSQNEMFGDYNHFQHHGGHKVMGESLKRGHVLAISLWDDVDVSMMWLDSWFPRRKDGRDTKKEAPGISRGPCKGEDESTPTYVRQKFPEATVTYTNFAVGCIGCTTPGVGEGEDVYKPVEPKCEPDDASCECPAAEIFKDKSPATRRRSEPDTPNDPATRRRRGDPPTRRRRGDPENRRRSPKRRRSTRRRTETRRRTKTRRRSKEESRRRRNQRRRR